MSGMYRITSRALAALFRLVMILSLAGYSFSTVNAVMHPDGMPQIYRVEVNPSVFHGSGHSAGGKFEYGGAVVPSDHHGDQHEHGSQDKTKNSCCKDYCGVAAIECAGSTMRHPRAASVHAFADDTDTTGEAPSLHRPPNI